jgi:serine-type D-Ala-D-Ala carboxypeptidase (penicillin-binding protein 5/6)
MLININEKQKRWDTWSFSMAKCVFFGMFIVAWFANVSRLSAQSLESLIRPLVDAHRGDVAVSIKHLRSGQNIAIRESEVQATASLIKFPIMVAAYHQVELGKLSLDKLITLRKDDMVQGSGILTSHFSEGTILSLRDAIRLMIAYSDNTATNLVLEEVGLETTNAILSELGFVDTRIHAKVYRRNTSIAPERSQRYGLGSTTAQEMVRLCELLESGELATSGNTKAMLEHLYACEDRSKARRFLPSGTKLAHKTGSVDRVRCDSGILATGQGPVAYCVLTENNVDSSWGDENKADLLCAEIAREIFKHYRSDSQDSANDPPKEIVLGSSGPLVQALQRTLNARMPESPRLTIDGEFGPSTLAMVKKFQEQVSLEATGRLSVNTWKKLGPLLPSEDTMTDASSTKASSDSINGTPFVTASAWVITDGGTGEVLFEFEGDSPRDPASTTKIMTALLVIEYAAGHPEVLDETIVFSQRADSTNGSTSDVYTGERISVKELLYGLMLPSGNDASVAFAEHFGDRFASGPGDHRGYAAFVAAMNRKAELLGLTKTHYENTHGLTAAKHKSSARDLARLARHAWQQPLFREIVSTPVHETIVDSNVGYSRLLRWKNTNRLLDIEGYNGIKTGTTDAAGACLVSSAIREGRHLIVVVLGAKSSEARYSDTRNLYRWAWNELGF